VADEQNHTPIDPDFAELMQTPVGRRWLLKAGFNLAAAGAVVSSLPALADPAAATAAGYKAPPRRYLRRVLQFALGAAAHLEDLHIVVNGRKYPLQPHTRFTRQQLQAKGTLWRKLNRNALTHFTAVAVPRDQGLLMSVHGTRNGKTVVVAQDFHTPESGVRTVARAALKLEGHLRSLSGARERLDGLGLEASKLTTVQEVVDLHRIIDSHTLAIAFTMLHPNVATKNAVAGAATKSLLGQAREVGALGSYIDQMQQNGQDFLTQEPAVDANGQSSQITIGELTTTFTTYTLNKTDPTLKATCRSAVKSGIQGVRNNGSLGTVLTKPLDESPPDTSTWHQSEGTIVKPAAYVPGTGLESGVNVQVENSGLLFGTYTSLNGGYSGGIVPLKLYNNFVRWVSVYVQYLKADGTNLSLSPNAAWPDTKHAQSLGLLPQVFTVLGVPIWDTNTIEVNLNFPAEATSARVLFCGLGSDLLGGDWRQYFPKDAYPGGVAPSEEVMEAALITGFLTLAVNAFALAADIDIASTWATVRTSVTSGIAREAVQDIAKATTALTAAEGLATTVALGGATYADISANHGNVSNLWSILGSLAQVLPKMIFSPLGAGIFWKNIGAAIVAQLGIQVTLKSIPFAGEVLAVVEAVGDGITLAEAVTETICSPWVIKNEVKLTYPVTVTVQHDPRASSWPVTATSWRLEATIDGAIASGTSVTGPINAGGKIQSDPLVLQLTAPFGGQTITWSMVVLDAAGHQVGTGVVKLTNNDPNNTPSTVAFAITELPAAITPSTVFKRKDTTSYSEAAGGYTWSDAVVDTGTQASPGIQEITGVTIATRLGVAGIVWKQNDKYYLRGVPVTENGNTISLGGATRQAYARRPFLLFDALVDDGDVANHVLLEPDDTDPGYHVRRLTIDPKTGALSWDPQTSLGYFLLPVSAAALHASGRVVAIHTDTSRLGHILPVLTNDRPPLANYVAGPGTQIGLLSSPTGVAVTQAGIILVLEAGASQLAAFDLNGNPVRYFGTANPASFTLPLPTSATYLDIAVDGSGQIYLLCEQNNGAQPQDYRIDVYSPNGTPVVTNSPGTNVPHLAVDYWRSIYAANFTPLLDSTTSQPRVDTLLGVAEPSLSRFDPM
jgi:hypothetical protein